MHRLVYTFFYFVEQAFSGYASVYKIFYSWFYLSFFSAYYRCKRKEEADSSPSLFSYPLSLMMEFDSIFWRSCRVRNLAVFFALFWSLFSIFYFFFYLSYCYCKKVKDAAGIRRRIHRRFFSKFFKFLFGFGRALALATGARPVFM